MITARGPRSVFISGAARGIGRATAELFLSRGWRVGMYDVDTDAVADAAAGRPARSPGPSTSATPGSGGPPSASSAAPVGWTPDQ